jgi:hypothetical protein
MSMVSTASVKPAVEEYHGFDSASLGDLDGDGLMELVVGVPGYNNFEGKAEFYSGSTLQAGGSLLPDANLYGNDLAGVDVANLGDIDNDGYDDIGIGSGEYVNASLTVFSGATLINGNATLDKTDALQTLTGTAIAGRSVGGLDVDQDGFSDVIMGIDWKNEGEVRIVSGYDIAQGQASLGSAIRLTGGTGSLVGHSNGWIDDASGDGYPEIVVSAPGEDGDKEKSGMVFVVDSDDLPTSSATANSLSFYTLLGNAKNGHMIGAEHSGDFDGDGQPDLVVSHPGDFVNLGNYGVNGRTFVHWGPDIQAGGTVEAKSSNVEFTSVQTDEMFGYNHIVADLNQDGLDDLVILAPRGGGPGGYATAFLSRL